jgi:hypothetical protein
MSDENRRKGNIGGIGPGDSLDHQRDLTDQKAAFCTGYVLS